MCSTHCVLRPDHVHGIQEAEEAAKTEPVEDKAALLGVSKDRQEVLECKKNGYEMSLEKTYGYDL